MNVVIVGANGMLGTDLMAACQTAGIQAVGMDLPEVDITSYAHIAEHVPPCNYIINCAAYTNVDGAETASEAAFAVNAEGPGNLARYCHKKKIKLIHISTDYVFNGAKGRSYTEWNEPNPISVYGASKLAGEKAIRAEGCAYFIVRTQSLFGIHGHNFVKAILKRINAGNKELNVVTDQISAPTYAPHLAEALLQLLPLEKTGIIHLSARGACSWFEFAKAIVAQINAEVTVNPIQASVLNQPAKRPAYSVLDNWRFRMWTGHRMAKWEQGLKEYLKEERI